MGVRTPCPPPPSGSAHEKDYVLNSNSFCVRKLFDHWEILSCFFCSLLNQLFRKLQSGIQSKNQTYECERSGSVVEYLTGDRGATGSSLTGFTVLCRLARHINLSLVLVQLRKTHPYITERLLMGRKESNQKSKLLELDQSKKGCKDQESIQSSTTPYSSIFGVLIWNQSVESRRRSVNRL